MSSLVNAWRSCRRRLYELVRVTKTVKTQSIVSALSGLVAAGGETRGATLLHLRGYPDSIILRNGSSDFDVFRQVFLLEQYECLESNDVRYIVDAGANVGLTSLYFLNRYPHAHVIAIEPDVQNFDVAARNLRAFSSRCHIVNAGIWSEDTTLAVVRGDYRDGRHWATQTLPRVDGNDEGIPVFHLQTLLNRYGFPRVDLLKVDVEGAEDAVFRNGDTSFLKTTSSCAVECHGPECTEAFECAAARYGFRLRRVGELSLAERPA
ncbi:Methyltransferase domain protein [Posidoniimonas corsicana]|uniref:Methyltransferase domain protein n=1 Tax=Posidoniimonas corsicana TaxID=1938618 RepID=A0A5C5V6P5_9BACT|nr:Methyltransferase domain protein [Posidoniimonas corsicana]